MAEPSAAHARDLGDYAALVRRRWRWVAGFVLAGFVIACAYLLTAQTTYVATAKVLVEPVGNASPMVGARTDDPINLDTEAQLVRSEPVATRAVELLGSELSPVALADQVTVTVPPNTTVLAIAFAARTAEDAQQGAETFARAYIENRAQMAQDDLDRDVQRLQHQAKETIQRIRDVNVSLSRLTGSGETADQAFLLARRRALSSQLASYNTQLAPIVGETVDAGLIIIDAQLPGKPVDPNPWLALPTGVMLGLVLGLAFAAWRERADKRIHSSTDVERIYGVVPLSFVGVAGHGEAVSAQDVLALYYQLRARDSGHGETVLLVGPDAPETAERLSRSLAVTAARSGDRVTYLTRPDSPPRLDRERITACSAGLLELPDYAELEVLVGLDLRPCAAHGETTRAASGAGVRDSRPAQPRPGSRPVDRHSVRRRRGGRDPPRHQPPRHRRRDPGRPDQGGR